MIEEIQKNRGFYIFESIAFIVFGILAIIIPGIFTYSIELLIGTILILTGLIQGVRALKSIHIAGTIPTLIMSIFTIILGVFLLVYPITGVIALTFLIALFFLLEGIIQLYIGYQIRHYEGWGWMVFSGLTSLFLSLLIWSEMPGSARWVIGLLVGINLLIAGFTQLTLAASIKNQLR